MWSRPIDSGSHWMTWVTVQENKYFKLLKYRLDVTQCKIVLNGKNLQVATGSLEELQTKWKHLETELMPRVESLDSQDEIQEFFLKKIECLLMAQDKAKNSIEPEDWVNMDMEEQADEILTIKFNLPKETLITSYQTNLICKLPRAGTSYISRNYFIFSSPMMQESIILPFSNITRIEKTDAQSVVGLPGVHIETADGQSHKFVVWKRDEFNGILQQLWKRAMGNLGESANFVRSQTEQRRYGRPDDTPVSERTFRNPTDIQSVASKEEIRERTKNDNFCDFFGLPGTELLQGEFKVQKFQFFKATREAKGGAGTPSIRASDGTLYISSSFICFHSSSLSFDGSFSLSGPLSFIIPLREIKKAKKASKIETGTVYNSMVIENLLHTSTSLLKFESSAQSGVYLRVIDACKEFRKNFPTNGTLPPCLRSLGGKVANRFDGEVLHDRTQFTKGFYEQQAQIAEEYQAYFNELGGNISTPYTTQIAKLTRQGIPLWMKSSMWQFLSKSYCIQTTRPKEYYAKLVTIQHTRWLDIAGVADGSKRDEISKVLDQIERDLHRSLPTMSYYSLKENESENEGILALRRVLHAFAEHNPVVGYCQSMNIVVAALLMFVDEEECFYLLCAIISKVPEYYERNMLGSIVDINLFCEIMTKKLPALYDHLNRIGADVTLVALPWFLTFYIGYVPWEVCFRVLDCFFAEGPNILLQVGLAVLKMHQEQLLLIQDVVSISEYMKDAKFDVEKLCTSAFEEFQLDSEQVNTMRNFHKMQAIKDLERRNTAALIYDLKKTSKFSNSELMTLYDEYKKTIAIDSRNNCLLPDQFAELFKHHVPWWPIPLSNKTHWRKLFFIFDTGKERILSFNRYIAGVDVVLRGMLNHHQKLAFDLYSSHDRLPKEEFSDCVNLVMDMHMNLNTDVLNRIKVQEFEMVGEETRISDGLIGQRRMNEVWLHIKEQEHTEDLKNSQQLKKSGSQKIALTNSGNFTLVPRGADSDKRPVVVTSAESDKKPVVVVEAAAPAVPPAEETKTEEQTTETTPGEAGVVEKPKKSVAQREGEEQPEGDGEEGSEKEVPFGLTFMYMTFEQFQIACSFFLADIQRDRPKQQPNNELSSSQGGEETSGGLSTGSEAILTESGDWGSDFEKIY